MMTKTDEEITAWREREARDSLSDTPIEPDPVLAAEGWERRFMADAQQAKEAFELYTSIGYEVRAEPVNPNELKGKCKDCRAIVLLQFKVIYTRKSKG